MSTFKGQYFASVYIVLHLLQLPNFSAGGPNEKRLLHQLLDLYNTLERPVQKESDPLVIGINFHLRQIITLDTYNEVLVTNSRIQFDWLDCNLEWNSSEFGNITELRIPPHRIWKPDILLHNSADEGFDSTYATNVVVGSDGNCSYVPPGLFKSICEADLTWFPFDEQKCHFQFGSATHNVFFIDLHFSEPQGDFSNLIPNGEWNVLGFPAKRNVRFYSCCPEPFVGITYTLHLQRRPHKYVYYFIVPSLAISVLTVLAFVSPPDSPTKLALGIISLMAIGYLYNVLICLHRGYESMPLLVNYFLCLMIITFSSILSSIYILKMHSHPRYSQSRIPKWSRKLFFKWLPRFLAMSTPSDLMDNEDDTYELQVDQQVLNETQDQSNIVSAAKNDMSSNKLSQLELTTANERKLQNEDSIPIPIKTNEWKFAAMVLDRLCLFVFTISTSAVLIVFLALFLKINL